MKALRPGILNLFDSDIDFFAFPLKAFFSIVFNGRSSCVDDFANEVVSFDRKKRIAKGL